MSAFTEFIADPTAAGASYLNAGSTAGAAFKTYAGGDWDGTSTYTPISGNPSTDGVTAGMWASIYVTVGATVAVYVAQVASVTSTTIVFSTTIKLGTSPATSAGAHTMTCVVGGAWLGPSGTNGFPLTSGFGTLPTGTPLPRVNLRNTATYTPATGTTWTISGAGPIVYQGYATTPGDLVGTPGSRPVIDGGATGASYIPLKISGSLIDFSDFVVQNNGNSGGTSLFQINGGARVRVARVLAQNSRAACFELDVDGAYLEECEAAQFNTLPTTALCFGFWINGSAGNTTSLKRCVAHDAGPGITSQAQSSHGFFVSGNVLLDHCVADTLGGSGVVVAGAGTVTLNACSLVNCGTGGTGGGHGFGVEVSATAGVRLYLRSCDFAKNAAGGITNPNVNNYVEDLDNSYWSTGTIVNGAGAASVVSSGQVVPGSDPHTSASYGAVGTTGRSGNFTLTSATTARYSGRGSLPQSGSYSGVAVYATPSGAGVDMGAAQSNVVAAAGGGLLRPYQIGL